MNSNIIIGIVLLILFVLIITTTILLFKKVNHTVKIVLYIVCGLLVLGAIILFSIKSSNNSSGGGGSTTVPYPPTNISAQAGNGQVTVTFTAPTNTGGLPIQTYTVTSSPGNISNSGTSSPIIISGLTIGTAYTFTVTATNSYGPSLSSSPSSSVTPFGSPDPPTSISAQAGNGQATVTFNAPTNTGGLPIQTYTVTSSPGNITKSGTTSPIIISGLTIGTAYTFTVTATNSYGPSPSSSITPTSVTPFGSPDPPTSISAQAGNGQATVTFNPPTNTGGLPIQTYTVTSSPGNITNSDISNSIIVSGLTNGTAYTFTVTATNSYGPSLSSSPSSSVTPTTSGTYNLLANLSTGNPSYMTSGHSWTITNISSVATGAPTTTNNVVSTSGLGFFIASGSGTASITSNTIWSKTIGPTPWGPQGYLIDSINPGQSCTINWNVAPNSSIEFYNLGAENTNYVISIDANGMFSSISNPISFITPLFTITAQ